MTDNITFLTRDEARKSAAERSAGYIYRLRMTGGNARVRLPNLNDRVFMNSLPEHAQTSLSRTLLELQDANNPATKAQTGPRTVKEAWAKLMESIRDQEELADAIVVACFLEPRVVRTGAELDTAVQNMITVADLHLEDRLDFLALVVEGEGNAARRLEMFHGGSVAPVSRKSRDEATATAV